MQERFGVFLWKLSQNTDEKRDFHHVFQTFYVMILLRERGFLRQGGLARIDSHVVKFILSKVEGLLAMT
jgi:hypothetical protein